MVPTIRAQPGTGAERAVARGGGRCWRILDARAAPCIWIWRTRHARGEPFKKYCINLGYDQPRGVSAGVSV